METNMKINELLTSIANKDMVLPEFQREYVWGMDQAKQLLGSLLKEYPVGGLLFWKTDTPPELKNIDVLPEKIGTVTVILDGQQRLTTLYMLLRGNIPPYYKEVDITHDPRNLYFNIESRELQYYQPTRMKGNPLWISVTNIFDGTEINVFEVASGISDDAKKNFQLAQIYTDNITALRNIEKMELPTQTVPPHASMEDAITIFDLVNSQGTKLTDAELALTHVTGKWAQARRVMKKKIEELEKAHFYFDLTFMTRALVGVVCKRALFDQIHSRPKDELTKSWEQLSGILDYLANVLPNQAYVHSTEDMATTNALIPMIVYLSVNKNKFPNEAAIKHAIHWFYAAQMWARYTSQTDQRLEQDISIVMREQESPWQSLCDQIIDQRGRLEVKADDMEGRGIQHPIYKMACILAKAQGAVDWDSGQSLAVNPGKAYTIHNAYVFAPNLLYKNGYDSDNHLHRKIVSQIANRVALKTNHPYDGLYPMEYLPKIDSAFPSTLSRNFIPIEPEIWKIERFEDFLAARRETIARKINEFMKALVEEQVVLHKRPLKELIQLGESATLEFKSTLQWDVVQNQKNPNLRHEVLKTIAAFLNSSGGTLVIGIEDNGSVFGLENDLSFVKGKNADGYQQLLAALITENIGAGFTPYIKIRFDDLDGKLVCVLDIDPASEPAYLKGNQGQEFYVRLASTSRKLDAEDVVKYVQNNWA
jgi:hypothetical protein